MKQVILDTSFILSCIRKKIDFFERFELEGYKILIPKQVINEIKKFENSKPEAKTALKILKKNKFSEIDLEGKNTDDGIIAFAEKNSDVLVATLDKEIQEKVKKKIFIRGNKKLEADDNL